MYHIGSVVAWRGERGGSTARAGTFQGASIPNLDCDDGVHRQRFTIKLHTCIGDLCDV